MTFYNPEVVELGMAEDLIRDLLDPENSEGTMPSRVKVGLAVYIADAE